MADPAVKIVTVTYQSEGTIDAFLAAAKPVHEAGLARYVVVDNDSTDDTLAIIRERHPWVTLIENGANVGFGRGCNRGAQDVQTPYLLFLNPDAVMERPALEVLVAFLDEHPSAGIVGPAIDVGDNAWHHAGGLPTPGKLIGEACGYRRIGADWRPIIGGGKPFATDWVSGAAFMIRTELFNELGGFDPRFFLYFDETDLCRRALNRGWEIWAIGEAVIGHVGGHSAAQEAEGDAMVDDCIAEHFFASRFYYLVKHHGYPAAVAAEASDLIGRTARDLLRPLLRKPARRELRRRLRGPLFRCPVPPRPVEQAAPQHEGSPA